MGAFLQTSNLHAGAQVTVPGIYVVSHNNPAHSSLHEVLIAAPMALPKCKLCEDVRFSFRCALITLIEDNEFFRP